MTLAKLIFRSARRPLPERSDLDRRWCSERRIGERRRWHRSQLFDRRGRDRRTSSERRGSIDRRGNVAVMTLWLHRCTQVVGDERSCGQPAILRSESGWRCFWHLDRRHDRRSH